MTTGPAKPCVACGGTGRSSAGRPCVPCGGVPTTGTLIQPPMRPAPKPVPVPAQIRRTLPKQRNLFE